MDSFALDNIASAARQFAEKMGESRIFAFYGKMGAGKTTFIRALCEALGVTDTVTSPTFSLVNEYRTEGGERIFHFDFYRIRTMQEALDMGCMEYFDSGCVCLIEWPELIEELLPEESVRVDIEELPDGRRTLSVESPHL